MRLLVLAAREFAEFLAQPDVARQVAVQMAWRLRVGQDSPSYEAHRCES